VLIDISIIYHQIDVKFKMQKGIISFSRGCGTGYRSSDAGRLKFLWYTFSFLMN